MQIVNNIIMKYCNFELFKSLLLGVNFKIKTVCGNGS